MKINVGFEVMAVSAMMAVFWVVVPDVSEVLIAFIIRALTWQ
jgi:hypothetical protein